MKTNKQREEESKATRNRLVLQGDELVRAQFRRMSLEIGSLIRNYASTDPSDPTGERTIIKPMVYQALKADIDRTMTKYYPAAPGRESALGQIIRDGKMAAFQTPAYQAASDFASVVDSDPELSAVFQRNGRNNRGSTSQA